MTKQTNALLLVGILFISSMAGCLSEVSSQVESENTDLKIENAELNSTYANTTSSEILNDLILFLEESNKSISNPDILGTLTSEISAGMFYPIQFDSYDSTEPYMNHARWNENYPIVVERLVWDRVTFDEDGVPKVQYSDGLKYVPTTAFHWGLLSYSKWKMTGEDMYFQNAYDIATWALENQTGDGAWNWYFDYNFSGGVLGELKSGWASAMTQGLGMSFLARMYYETNDTRFRIAALDAIKPLQKSVNNGGVMRQLNDNLVWYELYPTPDNGSFVLNGFIYSLIGLYDNWKILDSDSSMQMYKKGIETLNLSLSYFDLGCASSYDLVHHSIQTTPPNVARKALHNLHISLLSIINVIEDEQFNEIQKRFFEYSKGNCFSSRNGAIGNYPQYKSSNLNKTNYSNTHLLFETYNSSDKYMNHANWNGGLWERVTFDDDGIPKVQYSHGLEYVPTTAFHWGLVCISKWIVSGNQSNFDDAMEIANWAVANQSENGGWGWYFNHSFHGGVLGDMYSGWYGAMTQGLGMSFLARMYAETGNESFKQSALDAMDLFDVHVDQGGVLRMYDGQPWYEEYPTPDAGSFVLNGYIYALIGLHDLYSSFNSTKALELYTNGTNSLYSMIGLFDLGCSSSYDLVHHSVSGTAPNIARDGYHSLHTSLLSVMNVFENDGFQAVEDRWIGYANEQCFTSPNGANA